MKVLPLLYIAINSLLIQNACFVAAQDNGVTRSTHTEVDPVTRITESDASTVYTTSTTSMVTKTTTEQALFVKHRQVIQANQANHTKYSSSTSIKPTITKCFLSITKSTTSSHTTTAQCVLAPYAQYGGLTYKGCINCPKVYLCNQSDPDVLFQLY